MPSINRDVHMHALLLGFFDQIFHVCIKIAISDTERLLYVAAFYVAPTGRDIALVPILVSGRTPLRFLYVVVRK
jgi:hypothetical protein